MVTIKDVAREAGVSFTTVSHVLNGTRVVAPDTCARVRAAIQGLGYVPNAGARSLRKGITRTIGVVGPTNSDYFFGSVVAGISEACYERGFDVFLCYTEITEERELEYIDSLVQRNVQGIVLNPVSRDESLKSAVANAARPFIFFQRAIEGLAVDAYVSDDYQGARQAMEHLIGLGHRRIALLRGYSYASHEVRRREQAYRDILAERGITVREDLIQDGDYSMHTSYQVVRSLLSRPQPPSAVLCYSDTMALAAMLAARDLGLALPRDFSVVGYDDIELSSFSNPRLSTVRQSTFECGKAMGARIIQRGMDPHMTPEIFRLPVSLVVRESSGPAPQS